MLTLYFLRKKNVIIGEDIKQIKIGNAWIVIFNYNKKKYIIGISQNSITVIDKIEE